MADLSVTNFANVRIESVEIRHFRGIEHCKLQLDPKLTLIVGPNNSGKSRILRALAIGLGAAPVEADDLTAGTGDSIQAATIDIVLAPPSDEDAATDETFATPIVQRMQVPQLISEEPLQQRFAWQTMIETSAEGLGVRSDAHVMTFDDNTEQWTPSPTRMTRQLRALVAAAFVGESRNIDRELSTRGSPIQRILSDLDLDEAQRVAIETKLDELGHEVIAGSATLIQVKQALENAEQAVGSFGTPDISALPTAPEELARTIDITIDTGSGQLSSRFHGSGSKSLISLQVQSLLHRLRTGRDGTALLPHPVTLIEEPEAHLHPQAQYELPALLTSFDGQVIASTHSAHVVTSSPHSGLRILRQQGRQISVKALSPLGDDSTAPRILRDQTHREAVEKLKRQVERPFGELVFATGLVIGDGATERSFLPPLLRHTLGSLAHGICVIDPASMNKELARAAADFANLIDIPWFVFADDDQAGRDALYALEDACALDRERQLVLMEDGDTEKMMLDFDENVCTNAVKAVRPDIDVSTRKALDTLKGSVGGPLASALIEAYDDYTEWPAPLVRLVDLVRKELTLRRSPTT